MHTSHLVYGLVAAASLLSGSSAGFCRPSSSRPSSDATTVPPSTNEIASSSTTDATSTSNTDDASTTTAEIASIDVSSSTSDEPSSTSSSSQPIATFDLKGANSELEAVNGQSLFYRGNAFALYLVVPDTATDLYGPGEFHLEEGTNRLMVDDLHIFASSFSDTYHLTSYDQNANRPYTLFISCVPPAARGQRLECAVEGTSRTEFKVALAEFTDGHSLYIYAPGRAGSNFVDVDMIVS